jgi:hypothetical protein
LIFFFLFHVYFLLVSFVHPHVLCGGYHTFFSS